MATVLLIRHGRSSANTAGVLAGWSPDVHLDDVGRAQATALRDRLAQVRLDAAFSSPLERCLETAAIALEPTDVSAAADDRVGECRYGDWTGRALKSLTKDPEWKVVQSHPSAAQFPGVDGEALRDVQARAVGAVRDWNALLGENAVYAVFSHGDVIKAILADALGLHLDSFQRIIADPCSVSVIRYTPLRPFVERMNDSAASFGGLRPARSRRSSRSASSDAVVGGSTGVKG